MPSPIHRLVRTLTESKVLGKLLDTLPPDVRDALEYFVSDAKPRLIQRGPLAEGEVAQAVGLFLGQVQRGASLRGVNLLRGVVAGGTVRGCNVGAADVLDGDLRGINVLVGDIRGGKVRGVNAIIGDVRGGTIEGANVVFGLGGEVTVKIHVGEVSRGSIAAEKRVTEAIADKEAGAGKSGRTPSRS
jgi:hypothetical protein